MTERIPCPGGFGSPAVRFETKVPPRVAEAWVLRWFIRTSVGTATFDQVPALRVTAGQHLEIALDHTLVGVHLPHVHAEPELAVAAILQVAEGRLPLTMNRKP